MHRFNKLIFIALAMACLLSLNVSSLFAEEANTNIVIAAGETWGTYSPSNVSYNWPRLSYNDDISQRGIISRGNYLFYTTRYITSSYFGNPGWSWMCGQYVVDFANYLAAIEYNPTEEFAVINEKVKGVDNRNFCPLSYNSKVKGYGDPARDYHDPAEGGQHLSADKSHAWSTSAWPTHLGLDVKMTVHSWTTPWGHLDDFHLVEFEFHNTGEADIDADGVIDITNNRIHSLALQFGKDVFGFYMNNGGGRSYWQPNSRYRGFGHDLTPDENGYPWAIPFQGYGSDNTGIENHPGLGSRGDYYDAYHGYTFVGAKKLDEATGTWVEKKLAFKDKDGNEVVPAVGEGTRRGWFSTWQPGYNSVNDGTPKGWHISAIGSFYKDGGKSNDKSGFDLNPNPNLFESGEEGNPTTFVVKDPSQWAYPDGAYESTPTKMANDPVTGEPLGMNPMDPQRGRPLEPGVITEGLITEYRFDGDPLTSIGPFAIEVGETIRVYFVRGSGFRIKGLRKTIKAARAVFASIQPDGSYLVPQAPPVPEININIYPPRVTPLIEFNDPAAAGDYDGIKVYKSVSWPRYDPLTEHFPMHDKWWKTMDPTSIPDPEPYNPLFTKMELVKEQQGNYYGPYRLVKVIEKSELADYANPLGGSYAYAWEDQEGLQGHSYWYYVSTYKNNPTIPAEYVGLEDGANWIESGKVNFNGRSGHWEGTWPNTEGHSWFPAATDAQARKDLGARFVLVSPPAEISEIELGKKKIGVRPNPYKRKAFHDAAGRHDLLFYNLPERCKITIFDVAGMLIDQIDYLSPTDTDGTYFWDMYSKNGNEVASGLYIWVAEYNGGKQTGTFAIMR